MEKQLDSGCQGRILKFPRHHWRIFLTETIDAYEVQYIMVLDVLNAFIQTNMPPKTDGEERVIMKITSVLVDIILELYSESTWCLKMERK